ncbi:hypothetical protein BW723_14105 [Polaribacter reichenbachii]|uniref:Uncharacterized protein n=1 Tax=Polaribacter reichenbachii TaxID=996801 RepID=A0A1B8U1D8_9FLAO|nr:DUF6090 family protein [Polaribacter reichenbachii]APZ47344.1 hypothetical protein BW723_14105 [Polaribacter reichenbachii]AUC17985.1 hypothetical protein BTO17_04560 [Polaribacter reichenbachii]OBY65688.1 hypothetical protein LPB301_07675 [Polaribacter reichenbachii]
MIKFFRKIRQNLLSEGKTEKYFKYAIGEIILVVIGILIALQINTWNENRKANTLEKNYYCLLLDNLNQDKQQVKVLKTLVQERIDYSNKMISIIQENKSDATEFGKSLRFSIRLGTNTFQPNNATFQDIKSSGNLGLIKDKTIIKALNAYFKITDGYSKTILNNFDLDFKQISSFRNWLDMGIFNANDEFYNNQIFTDSIRRKLQEDIPRFIPIDIKPRLYSTSLNIGLNNSRRLELLNLIENEVDNMQKLLKQKCTIND